MRNLTYQNYIDLTDILMELQELNERLRKKEIRRSQELSYVKLRIKHLAVIVDIIFQYENRVVSGNIAYSISKTTSMVSCLRSQLVRLRKYIVQGVISFDSYRGLGYIRMLYTRKVYLEMGVCIKT